MDAAGNLDVNRNLTAGTTLGLDSATGDVTVGQVGGMAAALTSGGNLSVSALNDINLQSTNTSGSAIDLEATNGSVLASGTNQAFTNVDITAGQDAVLSGVTESTNAMMLGNVTVNADNNINVEEGIAASNITLNAMAGDVSVNTAWTSPGLDASGLLDIDAGNALVLDQKINGQNDINIDAGAGGVVVNAEISTIGNLAITTTAGGAIDVNEIAMGTTPENTISAGGSSP